MMWRLQRLSQPLTFAPWEGTIPPGCCFTLKIPNILIFEESLTINKHRRHFTPAHFLAIHDATQIMNFVCTVCIFVLALNPKCVFLNFMFFFVSCPQYLSLSGAKGICCFLFWCHISNLIGANPLSPHVEMDYGLGYPSNLQKCFQVPFLTG